MIQGLRWRVVGGLFGLLSSLLASAQPVLAVAPAAGQIVKNHAWSLSLHSVRQHLNDDGAFRFTGDSGQVAVGYAYVQGSWFVAGEAGVIIGPFAPAYEGAIDVDYQGTGLKLWWGFGLPYFDLRQAAGSFGLALGLSYADFTGHSFRQPRRQQESKKALIADGYSSEVHAGHTYALRVVNLSLSPTLFYCWLEKPRNEGSDTSQLITRIEGYMVSVAFAVPVMASYQARYRIWQQVAEDTSWQEAARSARGSLAGYTVLLGLTAFLGS